MSREGICLESRRVSPYNRGSPALAFAFSRFEHDRSHVVAAILLRNARCVTEKTEVMYR